MKECTRCGFETMDEFKYCPKCGEIMKSSDIDCKVNFQNVKKEETKERTQNNFSFSVKLIIGILAVLSISFFKLSGIGCILLGVAGGICSISMCAWNNKFSGYIPAILFFFVGLISGKHPLTQMVCAVYTSFEFMAGIKIQNMR